LSDWLTQHLLPLLQPLGFRSGEGNLEWPREHCVCSLEWLPHPDDGQLFRVELACHYPQLRPWLGARKWHSPLPTKKWWNLAQSKRAVEELTVLVLEVAMPWWSQRDQPEKLLMLSETTLFTLAAAKLCGPPGQFELRLQEFEGEREAWCQS